LGLGATTNDRSQHRCEHYAGTYCDNENPKVLLR
jgi:hypothetical protein